MEQFEQLLTCCVCLDRYRNPKLLPCQHSFCMEPCMEGLVDYVRRQVKCPECRAEHRIPYQGIQGYPTNVTLQRFLELHIEITGEMPDPTSGQMMRRCAVCTEKAYCLHCAHCSKEVCPQCKSAHMDILRREISRINHQVRRSVGRLQDVLTIVEKNMAALQQNCGSVSEEVEEIYRRLSKALKDRTEYLRDEISRYMSLEMKSLATLKENMELEISNIESNCDLADKHMQSEDVEWEDLELLDTKEIFLKTIDFLRHFEADMGDYTRRVRFVMTHDPNQLVMQVSNFADLSIHMPHQFVGIPNQQMAPPGPGLMRSKSDHRLASQYRQQEERYERGEPESGRVSPLGGRKFGDRPRYRERDYDDYEERPVSSARSRIRSRLRQHNADTDSDNDNTTRSVRFSETVAQPARTLDTEDVAKGPLSGITRLYDSPRVMKKIQDAQTKKDNPPPPQQQNQQKSQQPAVVPAVTQPKNTKAPSAQRQVSEEDEITKIKRQMKQAPGEPRQQQQEATETGPRPDRVAALRRVEEDSSNSPGSQPSSRSSPSQYPQPQGSGSSESDEPTSLPASPQRKTSAARQTSSTGASRRSSASSETTASQPAATRQTSAAGEKPKEDEETSSEEESSSEESDSDEEGKKETPSKTTSTSSQPVSAPTYNPPVQSPTHTSTTANRKTSKEEPSSHYSTTSTGTGSSRYPERPTALVRENAVTKSRDESPPTSPYYSRTRQRDQQDDDTPSSRYGDSSHSKPSWRRERDQGKDDSPPSYLSRTRQQAKDDEETTPTSSSRYGSSGFTSRFLNKSKSSAAVSPEEEDPGPTRRFGATSSSSSPRTRFSSLKERKSRLSRSKSSHNLGGDDDDEDEPLSPTAYLASKYDLARSRSSHQVKSREASPENTTANSSLSSTQSPSNRLSSAASASAVVGSGAGTSSVPGEKDGAALSSWARYLKNKYGARGKEPGNVSTTNSRRLSLGLPLRQDNDQEEQKNLLGSPTSPTQHPLHQAIQGFVGANTRSCAYSMKRRMVFSVGSRGSEPGCFTWPRGVAVGPDNSIVVADSSNHRVQVFDSNGIFQKEFGQYGNGEGEFDCLAGVAVNRIGQFIIADRYNHRIQVMDPSGRFLRSFGSQGTADGRFNYPWGVTTDALGFIYVCDKENHRVQVFQSDGTSVGKFGSQGKKAGQLDHPQYIAVSNTNKVIVSDSNNHRIQIFDVNGKVISSFGTEGSDEGQFKFPRGVCVDEQGYILVGDSGNNRIQVFNMDGLLVRAFGSWGSGDGEFKGLEGVAVMANSNILVCDRENHRIQVF